VSPPRWARRTALALAAVLVLDQAVLSLALSDDDLLGWPIAPFDPPLFDGGQRSALAKLRAGKVSPVFDPALGWSPPPGELGRVTYDEHRARVAPGAAPAGTGARSLAVIGCSFTHGDEVGAAQCWAGQLDEERPDLSIWNYGVGGYGLDQVLLRLRRDVLPRGPDQVLLGWAPFSSLRATTHFPPLQNHWARQLVFKPCAYLEGGALRLAPNPARTPAEVVHLLEDQAALLDAVGEADFWIGRAPAAYAPRGSSPMHHSALGRLWLTFDERRGRRTARWIEDPDSVPSRLVTALIREMAADCAGAGVGFGVVVLPAYVDLAEGPYWRPLTDTLGVPVIDAYDGLLAAGALQDEGIWMPGGHYSERGHRVVVQVLAPGLD